MLFSYSPERIKELRKEQGLSKATLARRGRISEHTVSRIEAGRNDKAEACVLEDIARTLGVAVEEISPDYYPPVPPYVWLVSYDRLTLINARLARGLTVPQLAYRAGISPQTVYSLEAWRTKKATPITIQVLAGALKIKPSEIAPSLAISPAVGKREMFAEAGMLLGYPS